MQGIKMATIVFYTSRLTGLVEFITMSDKSLRTRAAPGQVLRAVRGSHNPPKEMEYWDHCTPDELLPFLEGPFELWSFDTDNNSAGEGGNTDWDSDDGFAWEYPLVQKWLQDQDISVSEIENDNDWELRGWGGFHFYSVASEFTWGQDED
jgi:hypothetical protein